MIAERQFAEPVHSREELEERRNQERIAHLRRKIARWRRVQLACFVVLVGVLLWQLVQEYPSPLAVVACMVPMALIATSLWNGRQR